MRNERRAVASNQIALRWATKVSVCPKRHSRKAASELELRAFTEKCDCKEHFDNKSEWAMAVRLLTQPIESTICHHQYTPYHIENSNNG